MEDIPNIQGELVQLDNSIITEICKKVDPRTYPDKIWNILEVSQNGIFLGNRVLGEEFTQSYKIVHTGDIVYNPYRINIGSIGIVPSYFHRSLVSPAYIIIRSVHKAIPAIYILSILKNPEYQRIIMNYSLSSARANLPVSELMRIKIPKPTANDITALQGLETEVEKYSSKVNTVNKQIAQYVEKYLTQ